MAGRNKADETTLQIWKVPKRLKQRFRQECLRGDTTMREAIIGFMKHVVNRMRFYEERRSGHRGSRE